MGPKVRVSARRRPTAAERDWTPTMRRLFIYLFVALLVFGTIRAMHRHPARHDPSPPAHWRDPRGPHEDAARRQRELAAEARRNAQQALAEARRAIEEAK